MVCQGIVVAKSLVIGENWIKNGDCVNREYINTITIFIYL